MKTIEIYSKRNCVCRVLADSRTYISKKYINYECMKSEIEMLRLLYNNDVNVPEIIDIKTDEVILEDLGDKTLLEWLENEEKNNSLDYHIIIIKLLTYFQDFYKVANDKNNVQYVLNDVNLRNFILKDDKIFGIDFELCKPGNIESDVGKFVAYVITNEPMATEWKYKFVNDFIHIFTLNFNLRTVILIKEIENELNNISKRRNKEIHTYDILCKIAEEII